MADNNSNVPRRSRRRRAPAQSPQDRLLAEIRKNPGDDTLPLKLADLLAEHGEPARAEFIRVQVELSRLRKADPKRGELEKRQGELLREHDRLWQGAFFGMPVLQCTYQRGLLRVTLSASDLLRTDIQNLANAPEWTWVTDLTLVLSAATAESLSPEKFASPLMPRVTTIQTTDRSVLAALAHMGHKVRTRLKSLKNLVARPPALSFTSVGDQGAWALAGAPWVSRLRYLDLAGSNIYDTGALALACSPHVSRVGLVNLRGNHISAEVVRLLQRRLPWVLCEHQHPPQRSRRTPRWGLNLPGFDAEQILWGVIRDLLNEQTRGDNPT